MAYLQSVLQRVFSFTLLSVLFAFSCSAVAGDPQLLQKVYELSGLEKQLAYMGHTFTEEGLRMGKNELPDNEKSLELLARLEKGLTEKYAPERLRGTAKGVLARELDNAYIEEIVKVMEGGIWQKAVRLESRANNPDNIKELEVYVSSRLQKNPPRKIRLDLVQKLVKKTGTVDTTVSMMVSGAISAVEIMTDRQVSPQFEQSMRDQMLAIRGDYEEIVTRQFLFTYRFMSDEQLKTYVDYYDTPAIQSLNKALTASLLGAFK